jgi:hypothetical protein
MDSQRRKTTTGLGLETLEGRVVLSSATHSLHAAVAAHSPQVHVTQAHATTHKTSAVPNPVLVSLTPATSGITISDVSFDSRIHLITIKGTITIDQQDLPPPYYGSTPTYPMTDYLGVNATQAVNRLQSVSGYQYLDEPIADASVTKIPFTSRIVATAGEFKSGIVGITVTSSSYSYYDYSYFTLSVVARMRNAKAY